jgi:hypothetical protein
MRVPIPHASWCTLSGFFYDGVRRSDFAVTDCAREGNRDGPGMLLVLGCSQPLPRLPAGQGSKPCRSPRQSRPGAVCSLCENGNGPGLPCPATRSRIRQRRGFAALTGRAKLDGSRRRKKPRPRRPGLKLLSRWGFARMGTSRAETGIGRGGSGRQ